MSLLIRNNVSVLWLSVRVLKVGKRVVTPKRRTMANLRKPNSLVSLPLDLSMLHQTFEDSDCLQVFS